MSSSYVAFNGHRRVPPPVNEPIRSYAPGSPERASLKARLKAMASEKIDMPLIIGGQEVKTGSCGQACWRRIIAGAARISRPYQVAVKSRGSLVS